MRLYLGRLYGALRIQVHVDEDRRVRLTGVFDPDVYLPGLMLDGPEWPSPIADTKVIVVTLDNPHPYTVQTDDALKIRFSATVGEEPDIEVVLV